MDSESLDRCIQTTLSALYPPFQATSPTVLCQVLSVVESCYRGDGLRYLIHFLLPAKQFLANLQQDACLPYCGLLFRHEGWPLCVHEKVVVQLCPLDPRLLRPGDFYLLVCPPAAVPPPTRARGASCRNATSSSPRLLLCSVSVGSHHVEQQAVSQIALQSLFSMAWLDSTNREREQRGASRLDRCLLTANGDVFRVPWEDLVYPQFINRPRNSSKEDKESPVKDGDLLIDTSTNQCKDTKTPDVSYLPSPTKTDQSQASSDDSDSEGEYVELSELPLPRFSPQKGSLTQSISLQHRARTSAHTAPNSPQNTAETTDTHFTTRTQPQNTPATTDTHFTTRTQPQNTPATTDTHFTTRTQPQNTPATTDTHFTTRTQPQNTPETIDTDFTTRTQHENTPETTDTHFTTRTQHENTPETIDTDFTTRTQHENTPETTDTHFTTRTQHENTPETIDTDFTTRTQHENTPETTDTHFTTRTQHENTPATTDTDFTTRTQHENTPETTDTHFTTRTQHENTPETTDTHFTTRTQHENTHKCTNTLSPLRTNTPTAATHSSSDDREQQCSRLVEEIPVQNSYGPIILTPISTSSSSAAPPEAVGTSSWTAQRQVEGTDSDRGLRTDTELTGCTGQRDGEDFEEVEESKKEKEEKRGTEREEGEAIVVVLDNEEQEEYRKDTEEGETEEEEEEESEDDGAEEVEVEEEVQLIIVQQRREEEQQVKTDEERGGEEHKDQGSFSEDKTPHTRLKSSYSEIIHFSESTENHTLSEVSCRNPPHSGEAETLDELSVDPFCDRKAIDSYNENNKQHTHAKDPLSQNNTPVGTERSNTQHQQNEGSYYDTSTHENNSEDSKSSQLIQDQHSETERNALLSQSEDSHAGQPVDSDPPINQSEDLYTELNTGAITEDACSGGNTPSEGPSTPAPVTLEKEKKEEEEEEEDCSCEEVGGGRPPERQTEGLGTELPPAQPRVSPPVDPSPTKPPLQQTPVSPLQDQSAVTAAPVRCTRSSWIRRSSFYGVLLNSAALCLPGTRDRGGRALLTVCTSSTVWSNPDCDSAELLRLLLYYTSTLKKEVSALGLTVLVDARKTGPAPALFSALRSLQENIPGSVHSVLLLFNKDSSLRPDKPSSLQVEVLNSLKSVQKHVELRHLPVEFGGSFSFSQSSWLCFRSRVEQLTKQCEDVINLLQKTINILQCTPLPAEPQEAELLLSRYKAVMRTILEDSRLVQLQQEGGASLSRLRREDSCLCVTEDYRAAMEAVTTLYDQVDELLHRQVTLSNSRTQELTFILEFSRLEQDFDAVRSWLQEVGDVRLKSLNEPADSLELVNKKQEDFKDFYTAAYERCKQGEALLSHLDRWSSMSSNDLQVYGEKVHSFWAQLQDFSQRVKTTGRNIERAVCLYRFLDQAYGWALEGMRHLAGVSMEDCTLPEKCKAVIGCLEDYQRQHPPIPDGRFQEMKTLADELRGERGLRQWSFAWSKCQETKKMFDRKMEAALRTRDSAHRQRSDSNLSRSSISSRRSLSGLLGVFDKSPSSPSAPPEEEKASPPHSTSNSSTVTPQHTPLLQRLLPFEESADQVDICSSSPSLPRLGSCHSFSPSLVSSSSSCFSSSRRQQLRKTQSFDCPPTPESSRYGPNPRALSEPVRRGNTGVFIRGLEVSSSEAADHTLCPRTPAHGWTGQGLRSPGTPSTPRTNGSPATESRPRGSKLRHVVEEMVTTEREYVRSLSYIIRHYFPMMDRADLPQDLRGKRSVVFGNLEKLLDFHSQFFLKELEACWKHPLRVPHCFLRHQEQFGLYALYSKNKPKSDALLALHGHSFFRRKQVELGDKMDLSSYLLKPVQRMSKYALLLTDLMKEVGGAQEAEHVALQAATNMVKFQLRHGNDLLAMDAIRDCDVNLKEQGQLIRQDEFTVWIGRRKCQRHVFLFEELVLFSKPKKMEGGLDVFIYKQSFKTADVGLTETTGDNGLRFEIWFRRRTSKNQTFILQAATADIKLAWTSDVARILWTQATKNKEMRLKEMVSMGVGNKPFLDIQPSDAAISDRAVHCIMKSRGARTRASIAVSVFDHSNPFKRGAVTSDPAVSGPSSSSLLGPLNLHMYSQTLSSSPAAESSFITSCIEEDEQEHETSSQPSMTTESSGSSSRCLSGSTGSDSGCVSSHLQEALQEEQSPPSQPCSSSSSSSYSSSNKQHLNNQYISPKSAPVISPATIV